MAGLVLLTGLTALRAQVTEFPQTIEPGQFQVRMDAISLGFNGDSTTEHHYTALGLASTLVATGITDNFDVQVGAKMFVRETYQLGGTNTTHSGVGDLSFRTKWTFWRDDASGSAAVIPYLIVPRGGGGVSSDHYEGGFIVPWATKLGLGAKAGAMFEWDVLRNASNTGYDSHWLVSGYVRHQLTRAIGFYGEATAEVSSAAASSFAGTMGGGVTFNVSDRVQWDYDLSRGVGGDATAWTHVLRLRWKL